MRGLFDEAPTLDTVQIPGCHQVQVDRTRDSLITNFGRATLGDRYRLHGKGIRDLFARVARFYGDSRPHARRVYDYISRLWFMPAIPVRSNGGTERGLPIFRFHGILQKTLLGSFSVRNRPLQKLLAARGKDTDEVWSSITLTAGSVQQLDFLTDDEKSGYKTAFALDQRWVIEHAADRTPFICQSQSVNVFLPANVHKRDLHQIHLLAWKRGMKSLYHCRSLSIQRAHTVSDKVGALDIMSLNLGLPLEAVSKRMRYDRMRARWPGQIVIRQGCNTLDETRCGPRPPGGSIAVLGYAMEAT
jgi:ribonucleotide reductase alpha subunit